MNREPPLAVKKILRAEVGFGCPVPDCGNPYLEWHHFDPPWRELNHHNPEGMIALCPEHHRQADHGAFTRDQLHEFKRSGKENWYRVKGKFNWMRNRLLAVVGGNFYYETPIVVQFQGQPLIWFERNESDYLLLNLYMLPRQDQPRAYIRNNEWFNVGGEEDIECPPSGRKVRISYPNGDQVRVEFFEMLTAQDAQSMYPHARVSAWEIAFPITVVEVTMNIGNSDLSFGPRHTSFGNGGLMTGCFASGCRVGLALG